MSRPDLSRVPEWFHNYIKAVPEDDLIAALKAQATSFPRFLETIPASKHDYRYAEGKWSVKQLLLHMIDAERIFAYRALCFARKDTTPLPGFEENDYAENSKAENRDWNDMIEEFNAVRRSTEIMFAAFDEDQLESAGTSNNNSIYVRAIGFIVVGHINHHVRILRERYL